MNAVILITILLLIGFGLSLYFIHRYYEHLLNAHKVSDTL